MNENKKELNLDELDQVSGGDGSFNETIPCPYCSFTSPKTQKGLMEWKEHLKTSHPDRGQNLYN